MTTPNTSDWRIRHQNSDLGRRYFATAPGCPAAPHAIRHCECRAFKTYRQAEQHIATQIDNSVTLGYD